MTPGMHVSVVNSYAATSLSVPVSSVSSVDFPTDGNPMSATRPWPYLDTSKLSSFEPLVLDGARSCVRSLASLDFKMPRWPSVALFFCVRDISSSMSLIFSRIPMATDGRRRRGGGWATRRARRPRARVWTAGRISPRGR
eukprot:31534-Pelagococcus_subviridis.AAC.7